MRVAIFDTGAVGDVAEATSVLRHAQLLWGRDPEIHWFVSKRSRAPLDRNPMVIVHDSEWDAHYLPYVLASGRPRQNGGQTYSDAAMDFLALLKKGRWGQYGRIYAPAAYMHWEMVFERPLPHIPAAEFGVDVRRFPWRPMIWLTQEEIEETRLFLRTLPKPPSRRFHYVMFEPGHTSGQSSWDPDFSAELIARLPRSCIALCTTPGYLSQWKGSVPERVYGLDGIGFRQLTEVYNACDAFLGAGSGAGSITCAWRCRTDRPRLELLIDAKHRGWGSAAMTHGWTYWDKTQFLAHAERVFKMVDAGLLQRRRSGRQPTGELV